MNRITKGGALAIVLIALVSGCTSVERATVQQKNVCIDTWYGYWQEPCVVAEKADKDMGALAAVREREHQRLAAELADTLKQNRALTSRVSELEKQLADRDRELASLRSKAEADLDRAKSKAQADLDRANARVAELERQLAAANAASADRDRLAADLAASQSQLAALEKQLAERDKELASLQGDLSAEMAKLRAAERGLLRALRPQINKGYITIQLNDERLLINLASSYLFGSGEDQLDPGGVDALKQVGAILKEYPEYKVEVAGHTDNQPIRSALKKKFPTNRELSEARAANAAKALMDGGLSAPTTAGYSDTKPVASNKTSEGRAKNRRVEVRVTK